MFLYILYIYVCISYCPNSLKSLWVSNIMFLKSVYNNLTISALKYWYLVVKKDSFLSFFNFQSDILCKKRKNRQKWLSEMSLFVQLIYIRSFIKWNTPLERKMNIYVCSLVSLLFPVLISQADA